MSNFDVRSVVDVSARDRIEDRSDRSTLVSFRSSCPWADCHQLLDAHGSPLVIAGNRCGGGLGDMRTIAEGLFDFCNSLSLIGLIFYHLNINPSLKVSNHRTWSSRGRDSSFLTDGHCARCGISRAPCLTNCLNLSHRDILTEGTSKET